MQQRELDSTGLHFKAIGLGAMPLSISGRPDQKQAFAVIEAFAEGGGNFIDTANVYCLDDNDIGHNERLIREVLNELGLSDQVFVATKGGLRRPGGAWITDGNPDWLRQSCEHSLQALRTDCIGLYQLHAVDPKVAFTRSLEALIKLQEEGKIRHIGLSNVNSAQLEQALSLCLIASVQNRCNVFDKRDFHNGLIDFCQAHQISYIPYSPVGGHNGHTRLSREPLLLQLAAHYEATPHRIALAWLLHKGQHILPIPGASKVASIRDSLQATHLNLSAEDIAAIDRLPDQ
ncbi:Aldo/keto reductase [Candidatus Competibacter denitrificans Run_A_D11]|uniref:Aldo/keto reductase n=1 Tax=Candidatus Competibacter denitrificans Run_A_D11 TaxID=1400863 RepID=W6M3N8_9GAMM|nr:aldo/keto reductase [Candidatus Competibacter denitrificans]CDI02361.1 Aldo/keto reductase [Candidatus Competibacter denitrificans Run_A_D11]HAS87626.1 aldo/keto reductase [Candidatus Competibacteraceae bacterium]HRC69665.1 aldo/keto reductase [Candidatus Competibacter denitrificans]